MASATSWAFFNNSLLSTTWFTNPHFSAFSAVNGVAVSDTSRALLGPIMRESFCERPHEGNIPNLQINFNMLKINTQGFYLLLAFNNYRFMSPCSLIK
ncbi:hypothetical protein Hanom_Chr01g00000151 [Helianthus anomalus]